MEKEVRSTIVARHDTALAEMRCMLLETEKRWVVITTTRMIPNSVDYLLFGWGAGGGFAAPCTPPQESAGRSGG